MKAAIKKKFDFIPLVCLFFSAIYLLIMRFNGEILLQKRHLVGLLLLPIPAVLFFLRHKLGILSLGFLILSGLFGVLSYSPSIKTITIGKTFDNGASVPLLFFQPIFIVWLIIHLILSGRYYTGVASKKYWEDMKSDEPMKID